MQVCKLIYIIAVYCSRYFTKSTKDWPKHGNVILKEVMKLIEKGHSTCYSLEQLHVCLFNVFLFWYLRIELEKLEV